MLVSRFKIKLNFDVHGCQLIDQVLHHIGHSNQTAISVTATPTKLSSLEHLLQRLS